VADYIVGKRAIVEAAEAGIPISCVFVETGANEPSDAHGKGAKRAGIKDAKDVKGAKGAANRKHTAKPRETDELVGELAARGVNVEYLPRKKIDSMLRDKAGADEAGSSHGYSAAHQGIVAKVAPFKYADLADILQPVADAAAPARPRLVIVCDHITDVGNFGAIVRSAEALGACAVVIPNRRCATVNAAVYKTSAGAVANIPIVQAVNIAAALESLKEAGFWVAGATEHADSMLPAANLKGDICLVMGSEGAGISRLVLGKCDFTVAIPQLGHVESLNVAQATSVCVYEWLRQNADALGVV
jgi:23S rRNA (guanosine2251-2'-O)-methyltransferase